MEYNIILKAFLVDKKDNLKREKKMHLYESQKIFKQYGRHHKFQRLDTPVPHITMIEVGGRS